jgi:hypothetical protein
MGPGSSEGANQANPCPFEFRKKKMKTEKIKNIYQILIPEIMSSSFNYSSVLNTLKQSAKIVLNRLDVSL